MVSKYFVAKAREGGRGGLPTVMVAGEAQEYRYTGTKTCDARVGWLTYVETRRTLVEVVLRKEAPPPPPIGDQKVGREGGAGQE